MCLAIPGKIIKIINEDEFDRKGKVNFGGVIKEISLACLPDTQIGDYVIVHAGFAISKVNEEEANKVFEYLRQIDEPEQPGEM